MADEALEEAGGAELAGAPCAELPGLGRIRGSARGGVARFLGVPYAAAQRWRPPGPPEPWAGVREDPAELPRCPQPSRTGKTFRGHDLVDSEERCLVLNIWAPQSALPLSAASGAEAGLRPVLVYIPGGGGKVHSAHGPAESGLALARAHGLCCFHLNYRLGVFGFLAHPELSAEDEAGRARGAAAGSGNWALLDLVAALRWVQQYARCFGGDPRRVTIWGLSSGAQYACALLACPAAQGLFHGAVVQSCTDLSSVRKLRSGSDIWLGRSAEEWGCELGASMGCPRGAGQLALMRALPARTLVAHSTSEAATDCYEPCADSRDGVSSSKPLPFLEALSAGDFHRVPVLLGFTQADGLGQVELEHTMFQASRVATRAELRALFDREFGTRSAELLEAYAAAVGGPPEEARQVRRVLAGLSCDLWYAAGTVITADMLVRAEEPPAVFLYRFGGLGAHSRHGSDATFWRGSAPGGLSQVMAGYLANFAARGDPNGPGLPRWEQATATSEQGLPGSWMQLGPEEACMEELGPLFRARAMLLASEYFGRRLRAELRRGELAAPGGGEGRRRCTALVACQDGTGEAQEGGEGSPDRKRRCTASGEADGEKVCPAFAELGQPEQRVETERRWGGPA